jgi:hypothetical protein
VSARWRRGGLAAPGDLEPAANPDRSDRFNPSDPSDSGAAAVGAPARIPPMPKADALPDRLLAQARAGDSASLGQLFELYRSRFLTSETTACTL